MFSHRGFFLAVTILLASIVGVLVLPVYQYDNNPRYSASTESSKSEVVAHDNDVAAKSSSTDAKHLITIDSLLPEHEPTDTTDKRLENRQIRNKCITNPRSFGLYNIPSTWQSMSNQYHTINTVKETPNWLRELYTLNKPQYIRPLPQEMAKCKTLQIPIYSEMTPTAYRYADTAATPTSVQSQPPFVTYVQNPYRSNEKLSANNEIVGAPYDTNDRRYPNYNFDNVYDYPNDLYDSDDYPNDLYDPDDSDHSDDGANIDDYFIQFKAVPNNDNYTYNYNNSVIYTAPLCYGISCIFSRSIK